MGQIVKATGNEKRKVYKNGLCQVIMGEWKFLKKKVS